LAAAIALVGCKGKDAETRAREAERKIRESIPDVMGVALAQPVTADEVRRVQENLRALNEYLGEATGTLDAVTVSAIQAFQRTQGLKDNGILNEKTKRLLQEAAAKAPPKQG
jgi:peptidoglycan hydrolase-like protein with peptidoglycan-binding domain